MKKNYLLLFLLITVIGCEKEESISEIQNSQNINELNSVFKRSEYKDPFLKKNLVVDDVISEWKGSDGTNYYEYNTHLKKKSKLTFGEITAQVKYTLIKSDHKKGTNYRILKYISYDEGFEINDVSYDNLKLFTGTIYSYNLKGVKVKAEAIERGIVKSVLKDFSDEQNNEDNNLKMAPRGDDWIYVVTWGLIDWYIVGGGGDGTNRYLNTSIESVRSEWVYVGGGYNGGSQSNYPVQHEHKDEPNYTGSATSSANNHVVEIIIDESIKNYSCLYQTIEAVLNCQGSLYKETMASFLVDPKYDLRIAIGECQTQDWCTKEDPSSNEMIITIDPRGGLTNPIDMAANLLHESIHAEIMRYMNNVTNGEASALSRKDLFESYERYCAANLGRQIDHPYMAKNYITPIAKTLQTLDNNRYPDLEYYKVFAIEGIGEWGFDANEFTMANYLEFRNEVSANFSINCSNN